MSYIRLTLISGSVKIFLQSFYTFARMMRTIYILLLIGSGFGLSAQKVDTSRSWEALAGANINFPSKQTRLGLNATFDWKWLHTEARFNSEDFHTFSLWAGYNFSGGTKLCYTVSPMLGGMVGTSNGILPGVSIDLTYKRWELKDESAFVLYSTDRRKADYFYSSGELDFFIKEPVYVGLAVTRTHVYHTRLDTQRGLLAGWNIWNLSVEGYLYDLFFDHPFLVISLSYNF